MKEKLKQLNIWIMPCSSILRGYLIKILLNDKKECYWWWALIWISEAALFLTSEVDLTDFCTTWITFCSSIQPPSSDLVWPSMCSTPGLGRTASYFSDGIWKAWQHVSVAYTTDAASGTVFVSNRQPSCHWSNRSTAWATAAPCSHNLWPRSSFSSCRRHMK